jgi:hypothetical protein
MGATKRVLTSTVRRCAAVGPSVIAAAAVGVAAAGPASAATQSAKPANLCVDVPIVHGLSVDGCAYAQGPNRVLIQGLSGTKGMTNWFYPTSGFGQIRQADTDLCMQEDAAAGNVVIEATCAKTPPAY